MTLVPLTRLVASLACLTVLTECSSAEHLLRGRSLDSEQAAVDKDAADAITVFLNVNVNASVVEHAASAEVIAPTSTSGPVKDFVGLPMANLVEDIATTTSATANAKAPSATTTLVPSLADAIKLAVPAENNASGTINVTDSPDVSAMRVEIKAALQKEYAARFKAELHAQLLNEVTTTTHISSTTTTTATATFTTTTTSEKFATKRHGGLEAHGGHHSHQSRYRRAWQSRVNREALAEDALEAGKLDEFGLNPGRKRAILDANEQEEFGLNPGRKRAILDASEQEEFGLKPMRTKAPLTSVPQTHRTVLPEIARVQYPGSVQRDTLQPTTELQEQPTAKMASAKLAASGKSSGGRAVAVMLQRSRSGAAEPRRLATTAVQVEEQRDDTVSAPDVWATWQDKDGEA